MLWRDEAVVRVRRGELGRTDAEARPHLHALQDEVHPEPPLAFHPCSIAMGSASELESHLLLAKDLELVNAKDHEELALRATELKRMLTALLQELNADR
jgi:hypothetical protein